MRKIVFILNFFLILSLVQAKEKAINKAFGWQFEIKVEFSKLLSSDGSTRATAYIASNKIITADGKIFVSWLDRFANILIRYFDIEQGKWSKTVKLGKGVDNHSGPAITIDSKGIIHAVFGPHHGPFQYRHTVKPYEIDEWTPVTYFGVNATYPSLICDGEDNLHCTYRGGDEPRRLMYQTKPAGKEWADPIELVNAGVDSGYTQYGNPLMISPDGVLHLGFHIYDFIPPAGKSVGYLLSRDGGKTWENVYGEKMKLPVTPKSHCFVEQGPELDMRIHNIALDKNGRPWFTVFHNERKPRSVVLWHFNGKNWEARDLLEIIRKKIPGWEILYNSLTFDRDDMLYLVSTIQKADSPTYWGDPSLEIVLLTSSDKGKNFDVQMVSKMDSKKPNWLPNIERPSRPERLGVPSFLYTHGGPGKNLTEHLATEVFFVRLKKEVKH